MSLTGRNATARRSTIGVSNLAREFWRSGLQLEAVVRQIAGLACAPMRAEAKRIGALNDILGGAPLSGSSRHSAGAQYPVTELLRRIFVQLAGSARALPTVCDNAGGRGIVI